MLKLGDVLRAPASTPRMLVGNPAEHMLRATDPRLPSQGAHSVYVKIAEGCNRTCSFCAIPSFRGKQRSRPIDDIVAECERLIAGGAAELNLISQDTISFGRDVKDGSDLTKLVQRVADLPGARWVRLFYLYPETIKPGLVELLAHHPKVLPYVDMPLQHASDPMLKRMRRGHGIDRQRRVVDRLRTDIPGLVFRTAFIVGHPGETDADFDALVDFVKWAEFDRVGVFRFSPEEDTPSGQMDDVVPAKVANARARKLVAAQRPISRRKTKALVGQEVDVLVEGVSDESDLLLRGRWWGQAPEIDGEVHLANGTARPGEIRKALVTAAADHDLVADLADEDGVLPEPPPDAKRPRKPKVALRTFA
jgi:ribosomal protein S12 methylthiotransferase